MVCTLQELLTKILRGSRHHDNGCTGMDDLPMASLLYLETWDRPVVAPSIHLISHGAPADERVQTSFLTSKKKTSTPCFLDSWLSTIHPFQELN